MLFTRLNLWNNYPVIFSFAVAFGSFIVASLVTLSINQRIHEISGINSGVFTAILIFLLGINFLRLSLFMGITNIALANSLLWGSWLVKLKKGVNSYFELYFIGNLIIWDVVMVFFLFGLIK